MHNSDHCGPCSPWAIIASMATSSYRSDGALGNARPMLLAALRDYRPGPGGFADAKAGRLEAAADAHWFVYPEDEEVIEAWKAFYERVAKGPASFEPRKGN